MGKPWIRSDRSSSITSSSPRQNKRRSHWDRYGKRKQYSRPDDDDFAPRRDKQRYPRSRMCRHKLMSRGSRRKLSPDDFENFRRWRSDSQRHHHRSYSRRICSNSSDSEDSWKDRRPATQSHHRQLKRKPTCSRTRPREISLSSDDSDSRRHKRFPSVIQKIKQEKNSPDIEVLEKERSNYRSTSKERLDMNHYYSKSGRLLKEGRLKKALKTINTCLNLCSTDDIFLSKIYSRRGVIYSLLEKPRCSFQGFLDWEHAYIIDSNNIETRKNMSKIFFMAANKLYRAKQYREAIMQCNHALELDIQNGEAGILIQLLKRKIIEKENKKSKKAVATNTSVAPTSKMRRNPENALVLISDPQDSVLNEVKRLALVLISDPQDSVLNEVKRLNILIEKALENENFPRALILVKQALRLYNSDIQDDSIFRKLFVLKQNLMDMTP